MDQADAAVTVGANNAEPERAQLVKRLFQEAAERSGPDRERFVNERCGDDARLQSELRALLGADVGGGFLEGAARSSPAPQIPTRVGGYDILRRIADGGMGTVFEAVQENPRRHVALKLLILQRYDESQ